MSTQALMEAHRTGLRTPRRGWFRLALLGATAGAAIMAAPPAPAKEIDVGVAAAVVPAARGVSGGRGDRVLMVGYDLEFNERIITGPVGRTQVLFIDESSMTVGPNSDITLDEFVFDPATGAGKLVATVTRGALRFVGGKISKQGPVQFRTPTAVIGVRGGVGSVSVAPSTGATSAMLHFGRMTVSNDSGVTREITAPGFKVEVAAPSAAPSSPRRATVQEVGGQFASFERAPAQERDGGGAPAPAPAPIGPAAGRVPTSAPESAVAPPPVGGAPAAVTQQAVAAVSGVVAALGSQQPPTQLPSAPPGAQQTGRTIVTNAGGPRPGTTSGQPDGTPPPVIGVVTERPPEPALGSNVTPISPAVLNTTTVQPSPPPPPPPPPPPTEALPFKGRLLQDPSGSFTLPGGQTVADPAAVGILDGGLDGIDRSFASVTRRNGQLTLTTAEGETLTLPASTGFTTLGGGNASSSLGGALVGTLYVSPNDDFFFMRGRPASETRSVEGLVFGGVPTPNGGRLESSAVRLDAYAFQPSLFDNRTLPFAPKPVNDAFASALKTPFLVLRQGAGQVGDGVGGRKTGTVFAAISIQGQGAGQRSMLMGSTGGLHDVDGSGNVGVNQEVLGSARLAANELPHTFGSRVASVPDRDGARFFGSDLQHTVLDQNLAGGASRTMDAGWFHQLGAPPPDNRYGTTHVVMRTAVNEPIGGRSTRVFTGFAAGHAQAQQPFEAPRSYMLTTKSGAAENTTFETDAATGRLGAFFDLDVAALPAVTVGFSNVQLRFGGLNHSGSQSTFIDDRNFVAMDSTQQASAFGGDVGQTDPVHASGARSILVTHELTPENGFLPAGVAFCRCEFLTWGYWATNFKFGPNHAAFRGREDHVHMGAWVGGAVPGAGDLPASGTASYAGHAVGSVVNGLDRYIAAGSMTATYDFGTGAGAVSVSNFDGRSFSAVVSGDRANGRPFAFQGSNAATRIDGAFARSATDPVAGIMGQFRHQDGATYHATGIFAGQKN